LGGEEVGPNTNWFAGASATGRCLAGSGVVRDLMAFVNIKAEVLFMWLLPRFPCRACSSSPLPASRWPGGRGLRNMPEWLSVPGSAHFCQAPSKP
jgi:transcription initiation factor TFIID subunit 8